MTEGRDWVAVVEAGACPDCGFDAGTVPRREIAAATRANAGQWRALLLRSDAGALRTRPTPTTWSALEYGAHVRDVLAIMGARVEHVVREHEPELGWWDHDAAATDERYNEQEISEVAAAIVARAENFSTAIEAVPDGAWGRGAIRGDGNRFTVEGIVRFTLHEVCHHRADALASLGGEGGEGSHTGN